MFAFSKCLLCANVYACVREPVSITFYRLVHKSIFLTSIAAAASKRADLQRWESTASSVTPAAEHVHSWEITFTSRALHILLPKV